MIKAIRGTYDILPPDSTLWNHVEDTARTLFSHAGFREIRTPVFESTELFIRSIGEVTDIVEKEMYTFADRKGRSITLRPEGTACVVRACLEHKLLAQQGTIQKLFYVGPMFRYERPQAGRQRQFNQLGIELFGTYSPLGDADVICLMVRYLESLGFKDLTVRINSLGDDDTLTTYRSALRDTLKPHLSLLCTECQRRYDKNVLRVLDCKVPGCKDICASITIPRLSDHLSHTADTHYSAVKSALASLDINYCEDPSLVRGLDYYTHTIFEVTHSALGAQDALGGGGRYDNLVTQMGGTPTGAVGFAIGIERLIMSLKSIQNDFATPTTDIALIACDEPAYEECFRLADSLRQHGIHVHFSYHKTSLKAQMRQADAHSAKYALLRGENERAENCFICKNMREGTQIKIEEDNLISELLTRKNLT